MLQQDRFMQAIERIAAGLSQQNAQIYQEFQSYLQGYQQQLQQQMQAQQAQQAQREHKIEGVSMPTYHGRPHESVDEFIFWAKLFMQGKCIDFTNPQNGPRVVAMLAANFRDGAASWYHATVMVEQVAYHTLDALHVALTAEFVPPDQQFRLRVELRQCKQRSSVEAYVKDFRRIMAQIHGMHALDQVDHFCEGLKSETKKEVMYLRCSTLAEAIAAAQAYERTHFGSDRSRHPTNLLSSRGTVAPRTPDGSTPIDISAMDSRQIDKNMCRERNLCFYCKQNGHRIASCPRRNGQAKGSGQGNGVARRT
ncbi:LOW QUALITY PROTEIN: hypothetical protein PHPALM_4059 [Phytophthora palmivora]|uniref:Retrotransposon gag domain-containing protein n=1 Tax=Phytophthora palmivora TaxID=4796 RepID=A0A2P4YKY9_9STRA|nr:LOW QUALITY PROTEIN: hypothetical protein PHPALM_4059 [Phytophthora palmivora]